MAALGVDLFQRNPPPRSRTHAGNNINPQIMEDQNTVSFLALFFLSFFEKLIVDLYRFFEITAKDDLLYNLPTILFQKTDQEVGMETSYLKKILQI